MPARKRKRTSPVEQSIKPKKITPHLPLEIIDRIYSFFDGAYDKKQRKALARSMRVCKAFHDVIAPYLYRTVQLQWLNPKHANWKRAWHAGYDAGRTQGQRLMTNPTYASFIRHLIIFDHTHPRPLQLAADGIPRHVQMLEIPVDYRQYINSYSRWCDGCSPGVPGQARPELCRCDILSRFTCRVALLSPFSLFSNYQSSGPLAIARAPDSTFRNTDRVIIRPAHCFLRTTEPGRRICIGAVPSSVKRIDIMFEPHCHLFPRGASKNVNAYESETVQSLQETLFNGIANLLFTSQIIIPPSCSIYIVGLGFLGQLVNPSVIVNPLWQPKTLSELEIAAEESIRKRIIRLYGESEMTRKKLDSLHFVGLKEYASELRGIELDAISDFTWEHWQAEERAERARIAKEEAQKVYERRLWEALDYDPNSGEDGGS